MTHLVDNNNTYLIVYIFILYTSLKALLYIYNYKKNYQRNLIQFNGHLYHILSYPYILFV